MNKTFADHVTNTAFFLSMSKKQIAMLAHIAANPHPGWNAAERSAYYSREWMQGHDTYFATARALESKGLLLGIWTERSVKDKTDRVHHYELTRAGELVVELLREAGLVEAKVVAIKSRRKAA